MKQGKSPVGGFRRSIANIINVFHTHTDDNTVTDQLVASFNELGIL
jgi:hypothetical protein